MSSVTVRGADAREFVKAFNSICQWNGNWDRWNDMVHLFAIELVNTVDLNHKEARNRDYIRIAEKYKPEEFKRFADLFCILVDSLERNPFQDFLGSMYMQLDMGSKWHGQCFTPMGVCQAMASMAMPEEKVKQQLEERGWISINDCDCGAGATLIAAAERLHLMGVNYQQQALFIAQDLDSTVAMMCYIQLALLGCAGRIRIGDSITNPDVGDLLMGDGKSNTWYLPMLYGPVWSGRIFARRMDMLLGATRRAVPEPAETKASENPPEEPKALESVFYPPETSKNPQKADQNAQKTSQMSNLITATKIKRSMSEGQLMFDLTGGM